MSAFVRRKEAGISAHLNKLVAVRSIPLREVKLQCSASRSLGAPNSGKNGQPTTMRQIGDFSDEFQPLSFLRLQQTRRARQATVCIPPGFRSLVEACLHTIKANRDGSGDDLVI